MIWFSFLFGFCALHCAVIAVLSLSNKHNASLPNVLMASLLFSMAVCFANIGMALAGVYDDWPLGALLVAPLRFLWGPLLYLYALSMVQSRLSALHCLHLLPVLLIYIGVINFAGLAHEHQIASFSFMIRGELTSGSVSDLSGAGYALPFFLQNRGYGMLFFLHFSFYSVLVWRVVHLSNQRLKQDFSSLEGKSLSWLRSLAIISLCFSMASLLFIRIPQLLYGNLDFSTLLPNVPLLVLGGSVYLGSMRALSQSEVLVGVGAVEKHGNYLNEQAGILEPARSLSGPKMGRGDSLGEQVLKNADLPYMPVHEAVTAPEKYKYSGIDDKEAASVEEKLVKAIEGQRLYLDCDLTLPVLSEAAGVAPQHASQTLNIHMGQNFFSFVNRHRITLAKQLLVDPEARGLPIVDLAVRVGFKSKSSFYDAFKKEVQMTPTQYKKAHILS
jgi:AraC-like DNA-binding protein